MSDEKEDPAIAFVLLFGALLFSPFLWALNGLVLSLLWSWFIVKLGAPEISVAHAIGIAVLVGLLVRQAPNCKDDRSSAEKLLVRVLQPILAPLFALLVGWIAHRIAG